MASTLKRLLTSVLAVAALQVALFAAPPAGAVVIQLNDPNCAVWQLSGVDPSTQAQVLTCTQAGAPVCQISGAASALNGNSVTLTANCSPGPITTYAWTGGTCTASTTQTCTMAGSDQVESFTVAATSAAGGTGAPSPSKSVTWSAAPATVAPGNCTVTPSKTPVAVGEELVFTALCGTGDAPTSYLWSSSNPGAVPVSACANCSQRTTFPLVAGTATITVTPSNAGGSASPAAQTTVTVSSTTPPSGGGGPVGSCTPAGPGGVTKVLDAVVPTATAGNNRYFTSVSGVFSNGTSAGFGANDTLVVRFTAPVTDQYFTISMYETGAGVTSQVAFRTMTLSTKPCDFAVPKSTDAVYASENTRLSMTLSSGGASPYARLNVTPGGTYYINVKNYAFGNVEQCTNSGGKCEVFFTFANPSP